MTMARDERRVPYDPTRASLYRPGDADDFFTQPGTWSNSRLCAELSRLAYCDHPDRRGRSLGRVGLEERAFLDVEGAKALVVVDLDRALVAFRGTDGPEALIDDLKVAPVPWETGGRVHHGFASYFNRVRAPLTRIIEALAGRELVFTGHSLGAAAATLAQSLWPKSTLCTFGSPRVGNPAFTAAMPSDRIQRFVDCCDLVCRVPPEELEYAHVGTLCYIDRHGLVSSARPAGEIRADQRAGRQSYSWRHAWVLWKNVFVRDLADHSPINYVVSV